MQECIPECKAIIDSFDWRIAITVLSPLVAVVALITNYFLVKRQIYSNMLVNERKEWINTIRTDVANFASNLVTIVSAKRHLETAYSDQHYIIYRDALSTAYMLQVKIEILLNPNNENQKALNSKIERIVDLLDNEAGTEEFIELTNSLVPLTQQIIGQELKQIKQLI